MTDVQFLDDPQIDIDVSGPLAHVLRVERDCGTAQAAKPRTGLA